MRPPLARTRLWDRRLDILLGASPWLASGLVMAMITADAVPGSLRVAVGLASFAVLTFIVIWALIRPSIAVRYSVAAWLSAPAVVVAVAMAVANGEGTVLGGNASDWLVWFVVAGLPVGLLALSAVAGLRRGSLAHLLQRLVVGLAALLVAVCLVLILTADPEDQFRGWAVWGAIVLGVYGGSVLLAGFVLAGARGESIWVE